MIEIKFTYKCDHCKSIKEETYVYNMDNVLKRPCLPHGWHSVGNFIICNKHCIEVKNMKSNDSAFSDKKLELMED